MRGARAAPFRPRPKLVLLPLLVLLCHRTRSQGSPGPLQCYGVGPLGDLNCSWEAVGDLGDPSTLHLQSQKYHSNRTWTVPVPTGQSWVTIPREQLTMSDELLVWGTKAGQPLWPSVFVNLETRMKPGAPRLYPDVDFSEDEPLEATIHWAPPVWPPHKVLVCQFYYRRCQETTWTLLEPEVRSRPLAPVEIQDLELATGYEVHGRCRMEKEKNLWSERSPVLSFQTLPSAPKDVWVSGNLCGTPGRQEPLLLWKDRGRCMQMSYRVWFQAEDQELVQKTVPCCSSFVPTQAEWVGVSAVNATSWEPLTNLSLACLGLDFAPHGVAVSNVAGSTELLVTWQRGPGELQEHVVDWARDGDPLEDLNWIRLPPENLSALLPGNFEGGVPYRITVTAVSSWGLAPAPSVWRFREELAPLAGPVLWRLQDAPPGTPAIAWGEVPRHQLRGHLTHYTLCVQSGTRPSVCMNVSGSTRNITLPDLHWGPCELWVTASTIAGQGPPGPSLRLHLPDNTLKWKVLPGVFLLWGLLLTGCGVSLATSGRCLHLRHKVLPRWVWEKIPDPANSSCGQPHMEEVPQAQPPGDFPILKVEEMEPLPVTEPPQASTQLDSGYEKHFLPTPEELGLLGPPPGPKVWPEPTPDQERGAHVTDEDTEAQRG
ncbi:interleukin-27 receptor subunit alpha [Ursus maritimus]|uniref:Interleukin-27 receptor subunit alpha n=1 Tax=Ursus maritimus TaxID=29073 RepID=A0A8M1FY48_URSMA|nr:interleukin-27 receptor subunit alpha isoform X2 [Ursus arctos]XP_040485134.1 interleukin-27 receptor subunit alpha [Ursus maritimus]